VLCGSADLAEDLVQETYARVLARPRLLRGDDAFSYMARALRNTFYNHLRSARARPEQALAADQREVVALVDIAGLSYKEAARVLRRWL